MTIRYNPDLTFHYDRSLEDSARIEEKLKEIHDEYQERSGEHTEERSPRLTLLC